MIKVGLIGDYEPRVTAHRAIPPAIRLAAEALGLAAEAAWVPTTWITDAAALSVFDGLWCVPASPYRSTDGALLAIRHAREARRPFLGTCGGFQHAVIEYARHVLGWADADHAETVPHATRSVISLLSCSLVDATETLTLLPGTRIRRAYGFETIAEAYQCRYGLNQEFLSELTAADLRVAATGPAGEVRALELESHPFFVTTLFQPERAALRGRVPPLVRAFIRACHTAMRR